MIGHKADNFLPAIEFYQVRIRNLKQFTNPLGNKNI